MPVPARALPVLHWDVDSFFRVATFRISVRQDDIARARRRCPVARLMIDDADREGAPVSAKLRALTEVVRFLEENP